MTEREEQARAFKARAMRYKKPLVMQLSYYAMRQSLDEIREQIDDIEWIGADTFDNRRALAEVLGDEDEAAEFLMCISQVSEDASRLLDDLQSLWRYDEYDLASGDGDEEICDCCGDRLTIYDCFLCAARATGDNYRMVGFDEYQGDYYGLGVYEQDDACLLAKRRLTRLTKEQMIEAAHRCFDVSFKFITVQNRWLMLKGALEILRDTYEGQLEAIGKLNELYEKYDRAEYRERETLAWQFGQLAGQLPPEVWVE